MNGKRVVVIGSGPGGAGVAALLQRKGYQVTLLERNNFYGGKCWTFEKDGFVVDSGVHMFSMGPTGQHGELNRKVGGDLEWCVRNPSEHLLMGGMIHSDLYQSLIDPRNVYKFVRAGVIGRLNRKKIKAAASRALGDLEKEAYRASKRYGLSELIRVFSRIHRQDESLWLELDEITLQEFMHRVTDDWGQLQGVAALSMLLLVVPYSQASAAEFFWCVTNIFRHRTLGVPRGGSREIPGAFLRAFRRDGGELKLGSEATRIAVENGKVRGVETTVGEFYPADVVISNAGIKRTVELVGEEHFPQEYLDWVRGLKYSYSFITIKYGLERRVIQLPSPSFFNIPNVDPDHMFDYIDEGGAPADPFLFTPMPSEWDTYMAPPGRQLVIVGVPGPIEVTPEKVEQCERILDRAEERFLEIFPQVEEHIQWKMRTHIAHTSSITGKPTGECIGLAQCVGQTGVHKPSPRTPVEGLWLVGADAGARGVGTEQAVGSALYLANLLG